MTQLTCKCILLFSFALLSLQTHAADAIGTIKRLAGEVSIERSGESLPARLAAPVYQQDVIITGKDGAIGLLLGDDSRLSAGPNSRLALDKFRFDSASQDGEMDVSVKKGTLSVIAGKMVQKNPGSLKVKTPAAILAVRGTEFSVKVEDPDEAGDK